LPPHELKKSEAGYTGLGLSSTTKVSALALGGGHRSEERALKEAADALQQLQPQALQQLQGQAEALQPLQQQAFQQLHRLSKKSRLNLVVRCWQKLHNASMGIAYGVKAFQPRLAKLGAITAA
jgi:hypothetical protein